MPAACPALQLNPETDWMYTADAGEAGLGLARRPDDGAARQDARRLVGHQLHGVRPRPSRATSTPGPPAARPAGATTTCCPTSRRARAWPRAATSSSTPTRTTPTGPLGVSVRAPVLPRRAGVRRRGRRRRHPARRLQRPRPRRRRRRRVAAADHDARRQAVEHVPRVPRRRRRAATQPRGDHRRAGDARDPRGRRRTADARPASSTAPPTARPPSSWPPRRWCSAPARSARRRSCCCPASGREHELEAVGVACRLDSPRRRQAPEGPPAGRP